VGFRPYTEDLVESVKGLNSRLRAGGNHLDEFPETDVREFPKLPGRNPYDESFLFVDGGQVRGGYILRHQAFAIRGKIERIAGGPQYAISEGIVNDDFRIVGVLLLQHALRQQPLLYGLGMGGMQERLPKLLRAMRWTMVKIPFYFRVLNAERFLDNINFLRQQRSQRWLLELLRHTNLGWAVIRSAQFRTNTADHSTRIDTISEFGCWADSLWEQCADKYSLIAVRDSRTLNTRYPSYNPRFLRLRVLREGNAVGWAVVLNTQMSGHKYFGNMRVASIVDCLALPEDAPSVIRLATNYLSATKADIIVSNQSSLAWRRALYGSEFVRGPSNFILGLSRRLVEKLQPFALLKGSMHMNRGDGDGPIHL
jgi:hypothetical protein